MGYIEGKAQGADPFGTVTKAKMTRDAKKEPVYFKLIVRFL
jgi:hypothetical protein